MQNENCSASRVQDVLKNEEISIDQAEALVAHQQSFSLDHLKRLSPGVAQALGKCRHEIHLPSLTSITEASAFWLSSAPMLYLAGLRPINAKVAGHLKETQVWLDLGGLTSLSVAVARELAKTRAWLSLRGLRYVSPELAQALAAHEGVGLSLRGVTSITKEAAHILAQHRGGTLRLSSLRNAPEDIRKVLRKHARGVCYH